MVAVTKWEHWKEYSGMVLRGQMENSDPKSSTMGWSASMGINI